MALEMTPSLMGLAVGAAIGVLDYIVLTFIGNQMAKKAIDHEASQQETRQVTGFMRNMALISLIIFPIIGYFAGPYVFGSHFESVGG
ncbi:MAG: hypothetical protein DHS20C07_19540 [Methyloligella sp.]|nr:MAG: hypothetical protein DHS20C07_19540 [Methyloligella sp.]